MGIVILTAKSPARRLALKILAVIQSEVEPEAIVAARKFKELMDKKGWKLADFEKYFTDDGFAYVTARLAYLWEIDRPKPKPNDSAQELREKAYSDAQKVVEDAEARLGMVKRRMHYSDRFYRNYCKSGEVDRWERAALRRDAEKYVKEYLKLRRELKKARKEALKAGIQCWKRNPDKCPGDGWVWVNTHQRRSPKGKVFTVEGFWRAPRKPKETPSD